jgi:hypothetical protein
VTTTTTTSPKSATEEKNTDTDDTTYELSVDLQVLKHLGVGLYSNVPAVVSEMVANAYDADASRVDITVADLEVVIKDDGSGMDVQDANKKFLTVGYDKRNSGEPAQTPKFKRWPMGRKGIGKLSAFAIANEVEVRSVKTAPDDGKVLGECAFVMDVDAIKTKAKEGKPYHPTPLKSKSDFEQGTRITLRKLKRTRNINADYIRHNLAMRFSVFGKDFNVYLNGKEVTVSDRQYWDKLQFLWELGDGTSSTVDDTKLKKVRKREFLTGNVKMPGLPDETVSGWIGTVHLPRELKDGVIDNNGIVVMARGKLVHENMLPFARTARIFAEYVVGQIDADWLDEDMGDDMATSDRQSLREDDPRFAILQSYVKDRLDEIANKWSEWRKETGLKDAVARHPIIQDWLNSMTLDNKKQAEKLIATIEAMPVAKLDDKKELIRHGIMAFETLALKGNLTALSDTGELDVDALKNIMSALEDLEIAHYYQVAKGRLAVLNKFEGLVDKNAKEKFLQEEIFENTWLMDPSWERPTNDKRKEERFTKNLAAASVGLSKNAELSRYDIRYLTVSGKDLILELKRGGRPLNAIELIEQVRKYGDIVEHMQKRIDPSVTPNYEIILLVGERPENFTKRDESSLLNNYNARIMTYEKVIDHARATYKDFLDNQDKVSRIQKIADSL